MKPDYEPVGLSNDMSRAGLLTIDNMERVINSRRAPNKAVKPTKENVSDFPITWNNPIVDNFVRKSVVTENNTKSGDIVRHPSIFCCTDEQLPWLRNAKCVKIDGTF